MPKRIAGLNLYSTAEVAELLGTTDRSVRNYIARGHLSARRMGRRLLIPDAEIRQFFGQPRSGPQPTNVQEEAAR
jgi:excisionase family DNA binding protein